MTLRLSQVSNRFFLLLYLDNRRIVYTSACGGHKYFRLDEMCVTFWSDVNSSVQVLRLNWTQNSAEPMELDAQGVSYISQLLKPNSHRRFEPCSLYRDTISSTIPSQVLLSGLSMCFMCQCFDWVGVVVT